MRRKEQNKSCSRLQLISIAAICLGSALAGDTTAPEFDVCHLFKSETQFVTQTLYMAMEDVRHQLTVPTVYFEDRFDQVNGSEHRAQLFRVMIDDFTPVTRQDTASLRMAGRRDYFNFVLHDPIDLDGILPIAASRMATGDRREMSAYHEVGVDFGLSGLLPLSGAEMFRDVFVARMENGELSAIISCSNDPTFMNHSCNHDFRAHEIDVRMNYPRAYLKNWDHLQSSVSNFMSCALTH